MEVCKKRSSELWEIMLFRVLEKEKGKNVAEALFEEVTAENILEPMKEADPQIQVSQEIETAALAGVVQWIECSPANQRVAGSIPSPGTWMAIKVPV